MQEIYIMQSHGECTFIAKNGDMKEHPLASKIFNLYSCTYDFVYFFTVYSLVIKSVRLNWHTEEQLRNNILRQLTKISLHC